MFIGLSANPNNKLRSEERNSGRASALQNDSAPPNGAGGFGGPSIYKDVTPSGVNFHGAVDS